MLGKRTQRGGSSALRKAHGVIPGMSAGLLALSGCSESRSLDAEAVDGGPNENDSSVRQNAGFGNPTPVPQVDAGGAPDLATDVVRTHGIARNPLYSWTTERQVAELRADPVLLTRAVSSTGERTQLSMVIAAGAAAADPIAQVLAAERFQKGRYAWVSAWPTLRGWPDESYGNQLLRIELKPEALIVNASGGGFTVVDLKGDAVDAALALEHPERIGAVYFVNVPEDERANCGTFANGCGTGTYREYFINNEQMVQRWELGTQAVLDEIERGISVVSALRMQVASGALADPGACELSRAAYCSWSGSYFLGSGALPPYLDALALSSDFYRPTTDNMDDLLAALQDSRFEPDPFVHEP